MANRAIRSHWARLETVEMGEDLPAADAKQHDPNCHQDDQLQTSKHTGIKALGSVIQLSIKQHGAQKHHIGLW